MAAAAAPHEGAGMDHRGRSVVSEDELGRLLTAIHDPDAKLDEISRSFHAAFPEAARFRGCCALVIMLRDYLLTLPQRLAVYYVLFDVYRRHKLGVNPFMQVFINAVQAGAGVSRAERSFAQQLLLSAPTDKAVGQRSPASLVEELSAAPPATTPDLSAMVRDFEASLPAVPLLLRAESGPVVIDAAGAEARLRGRRAIQHAMTADATGAEGGAAAASRGSMATQGAEAAASSPSEPLAMAQLPAVQPSSVAAALRLPLTPGQSARAEGTEAGAAAAVRVAGALAAIAQEEERAARAGGDAASAASAGPAAHLRGGVAGVPPALVAAAALDAPAPDELGPLDLFRLGGLQPTFARPPPPLVPLGNDEMVWIDAVEPPSLLWEAGMGDAASAAREVGALMKHALAEPLDDAALGRMHALLAASPRAVFDSGLSPDSLPSLVLKNARVAVECLKLLRGSAQSDDFLEALVRMPMTLESMEVVNRIATDMALPKRFLHLYITNCITFCETITEPHKQSRHVRLVGVFLQSLIRGRVINVKDMLVEVRAFCIRFSDIKEANNLFKVLRKYEESESAAKE